MNRVLRKRTLLSVVALGAHLAVGACSSPPSSDASNGTPTNAGNIGLELTVAGAQINTVHYDIVGPTNTSGDIDVSSSTTVSAFVGGLAAGGGYTITLSATSTDGKLTCAGQSMFAVVSGTTTSVPVTLACKPGRGWGSIGVGGVIDICPNVTLTATPLQVTVGSSVDLTATAVGADGGVPTFQYTSTAGGTFADATASHTTFTCGTVGTKTITVTATDSGCASTATAMVTCSSADPLQNDIQTIVVIYAENRSFDGLFGNFPGARGLSEVVDGTGTPTAAYIPQKDRDGTTVLAKLPQTWGGATAAGNPTVVTQAQTDNLANAPFSIESAFTVNGAPALTTTDVTRDLAHRFFENMMEINGGTNDMFGAWIDAGGLTMGHFDYSHSSLYALARQYVLADNFFEGAFGGSFLNHQYLVCGCAPTVPSSFITSNSPSLNVLGSPNGKAVPQLAVNTTSPPSALTGSPSLQTGNIAPLNYFGAGDGYRAVNTMQPAYQPSGNFPATGATDLHYANPAAATTLPAQTQTTIGDLLAAKGVDWAWYATSWAAATADGAQPAGSTHTVIYAPSTPRGAPDFQAHHHPFNYYAAFDPATQAANRTQHMRDYNTLLTDIQGGTLPPVVYYKPTGNVNQHPGYANVDDADAHIANLVNSLRASAQWNHMVIVITYDEYGGQWDHVAPPKGDLVGPGTRIPALIISPYAKVGTVDHTQYDTGSILRLIARRFGLSALPGVTARDQALVTNGGSPMGDLTNALNLP